jgi:hypothetical protein
LFGYRPRARLSGGRSLLGAVPYRDDCDVILAAAITFDFVADEESGPKDQLMPSPVPAVTISLRRVAQRICGTYNGFGNILRRRWTVLRYVVKDAVDGPLGSFRPHNPHQDLRVPTTSDARRLIRAVISSCETVRPASKSASASSISRCSSSDGTSIAVGWRREGLGNASTGLLAMTELLVEEKLTRFPAENHEIMRHRYVYGRCTRSFPNIRQHQNINSTPC